jgi:hypothetical protein
VEKSSYLRGYGFFFRMRKWARRGCDRCP